MTHPRRLALLAVAAAACLELHAPPEQPFVPPLQHTDILIDSSYAFYPQILLEGSTGIHLVYVHFEAIQESRLPISLRYAGCAGGCEAAENWIRGTFDSSGGEYSIPSATLNQGGIHIAYETHTPSSASSPHGYILRYSTCAAGCRSSQSWQSVDVDSLDTSTPTYDSYSPWPVAVTAGPTGVLHLVYTWWNGQGTQLKYAQCTGLCTDPAHWVKTVLDTTRPYFGPSALRADAAGRLHLAYATARSIFDSVRYGTCASACLTANSWALVTLAPTQSHFYGRPSMTVTPSGAVHLAFTDYVYPDSGAGDSLRYMYCPAVCSDTSHWVQGTIGRLYDPDMVASPGGGLSLVASGPQDRAITYGKCTATCTVPSQWTLMMLTAFSSCSQGGCSVAENELGETRIAYSARYETAVLVSLLK